LRPKRAKARNAAQIYRLKPFRRGANAEFRLLDKFGCSKNGTGVKNVNCSALP
jgi:hypothetical protein